MKERDREERETDRQIDRDRNRQQTEKETETEADRQTENRFIYFAHFQEFTFCLARRFIQKNRFFFFYNSIFPSSGKITTTDAVIITAKLELGLTEFVCHQVASLTAVLLAMVVYSCFVTLQCMRVTLIKNLMVAILFQEHITLVLQVGE